MTPRPASCSGRPTPSPAGRARQRDLAGRHLDARRRHDLADRRLRRRDQHAVLGHRQSRPLELGPQEGRQSLEQLAARARPRHRRDQVGLSVHAERRLGLRRQQRADPDRRRDRRPSGQGGGAVEPQRLLLRPGPHHRRVHLRRADHRRHQLDQRARSEGRPAAGQRGDAADQRRRDHRADRARPRGRHQLVPDGLQPRLGYVFFAHQPLGHGADRLEARGRGVQGGRALHGRRLPDVPARGRHRLRQGVRRREQGVRSGRRPSPLPLFSGLLATKSGLVFTGDQLGLVHGARRRTGETLWQFQTGSGINASPITYELDGTQYVAILSGLGGDPSFYFKGPKGGMLWVFALENQALAGGRHEPGADRGRAADASSSNLSNPQGPRARPAGRAGARCRPHALGRRLEVLR